MPSASATDQAPSAQQVTVKSALYTLDKESRQVMLLQSLQPNCVCIVMLLQSLQPKCVCIVMLLEPLQPDCVCIVMLLRSLQPDSINAVMSPSMLVSLSSLFHDDKAHSANTTKANKLPQGL